jgi:hypothetical protein
MSAMLFVSQQLRLKSWFTGGSPVVPADLFACRSEHTATGGFMLHALNSSLVDLMLLGWYCIIQSSVKKTACSS